MLPKPYTALAIAVGSGKIGYVFIIDGELSDWGLTQKHSKSPEKAVAKVKEWIDYYAPNIVITEKLTFQTRKSGRTVTNIQAISDLAERASAHHIEVVRVQWFDNKYEEIGALCERYPLIANLAPKKRRLWESEHPNTVIFEALSLVGEAE